ncbi:MAG: hypothetical protein LQ343_000104 [Gyalolechia ehrenbergii]|nr:MAG: hypothetical protein LQ343_000104 [Gyalolechia ehrenbergii]
MYNWLSPTKTRKSHARSQSSPYLQPSQSSSPFDDEHHSPCRPELSEPPLTHQPTTTTRHLPPLITHDLNPQPRSTNKIAGWFSGESQSIPFSILPSPTREQSHPTEAMPTAQPTPSEKSRNTPKPPIISRFSLFGTKPIPPLTIQDEWHDLDVKSALIPSGSADPFSPSAFKNLQQNAQGLLSKLHAAYKQRSQALHDILAEKEVQAEELKGAEMRTRHLKIQLDDMTAKLVEQDKAMMDLVDQLAHEKQSRKVEDSNMEPDQKSRTSTASDMSLDSKGSCTESLFSRPRATSPISMSSVSSLNSSESQPLPHRQAGRISQCHAPKTKATCNAESEAWNLVEILKLENTNLKSRLGQLENTVDDCLDMVKGLF